MPGFIRPKKKKKKRKKKKRKEQNTCGSLNPADPSDLPSNIAGSKLFVSKTGNKSVLKNKIFQISCLQNLCDLGGIFCAKKPSNCDFVVIKRYT